MADGESCSVGKSLDIIVPLGSPVFIDSLPERTGPRPKTNPCLPHQQRSDNPSKDVWEKMCKRVIAGCAELFPGTTGPHRSLVSLPDSLALFLDGDASIPCARPFIGKEFAHVHGVSDGSLHVGLSEADAQTVIKAGWGERHLLAGKQAGKMNVPAGLVMVYGPRNEQEIDTVVDILRASYKWARGDIPPLRNSA